PFRACPQRFPKLADLRVVRRLDEEEDITAGVVVDPPERTVDRLDPLPDRLPFSIELRLKGGHLADGILPQQFSKTRLKAGQVVGGEAAQHSAVLPTRSGAAVDLPRPRGPAGLLRPHRVDDPPPQPAEALILGVDLALQPPPHRALPFFARL